MKIAKWKLLTVWLLCLVFIQENVYAQAFREEIEAFKKADQANPPLSGSIVFVGSSSFRLWKDVLKDFPGYKIINRGFGGSSLSDVIFYVEDLIFAYNPKEIVIYCGENDFMASDDITAQIVADRFSYLYNLIRAKLPNVPVVYVSIKPSPSREKYLPKFKEANRLIRDMLKKDNRAVFVNVYDPMMKKGKPDESLFSEDQLHMNEKGYALWKKLISPYLLK